ncbi:hypothetical protein THAOC_14380 [Thalassiosira oceanica]|uniref:Uncharacterized protein n=1 Tax=Thalassiosira oceanica TaxID=159749 RepID=K0T327_THAOC|nr:hypothetical protein THAOC_14380 [Thalassiosira oceanica]|eukprot:EJK64842.1 hypothetical protein THAOC_14380 [Thalassiosira oceanica]
MSIQSLTVFSHTTNFTSYRDETFGQRPYTAAVELQGKTSLDGAHSGLLLLTGVRESTFLLRDVIVCGMTPDADMEAGEGLRFSSVCTHHGTTTPPPSRPLLYLLSRSLASKGAEPSELPSSASGKGRTTTLEQRVPAPGLCRRPKTMPADPA